MRTTEGYVRYGASLRSLELEVKGRMGIDGALLRELQLDVTRKLGSHGDATRIKRITLTVGGDTFSATFEEEVG